MYWYLNKKTDEAKIFGCRPPIVKLTGLTKTKLDYFFSTHRQVKYEDEEHRIERMPVIRGGKNK